MKMTERGNEILQKKNRLPEKQLAATKRAWRASCLPKYFSTSDAHIRRWRALQLALPLYSQVKLKAKSFSPPPLGYPLNHPSSKRTSRWESHKKSCLTSP